MSSFIKNENLDVLFKFFDDKEFVHYKDEIAKTIIEKSSIENLCELYNLKKYKYYQTKIIEKIIKIFDYRNEKDYKIIEETFIDTSKIVKGIIEKNINIYPYKKINNDFELKSISLNGRFSIGYGEGHKLNLMDNDKIVCVLNKNAKGGNINNQGTQILCNYEKPHSNDHKIVYDVTNPNNIISRKIFLRETSRSSDQWSPDGKYLAICQNRLVGDNIGPDKFDSMIINTPVTGSYRDIHIYHLINDNWDLVKIFSISQDIARSAIWSEDGECLAVLYTNKKLRVWNFEKSEVIQEILNVQYDSTVGYSKKYLATVTKIKGEDNYRVNIYDIKTWELINSIDTIALNGGISILCFHPQESYLIIKDHLGYSRVWNFLTGIEVSIINRNIGQSFITFNETGDKIISGAGIWNFTSTDDLVAFIDQSNKYSNFKNDILKALNYEWHDM